MKVLTKIFGFVKNLFGKVAELFKNKRPKEIIDDTYAVVGVAGSAALALVAGINKIRVNIMRAKAENKKSNANKDSYTGHEYVEDLIGNESITDKFAKFKNNKYSKKDLKRSKYHNEESRLSEEEAAALHELCKTRNVFFKSLTVDEQLDVLDAEKFDFKEYVKNFVNKRNKQRRHPFAWSKTLCKLGVTDENAAFREPVDYGFFNFILRPIDDFIHWLKNDPVPKKVRQIHLVEKEEIPSIPCETAFEFIDICQSLNNYMFGGNPESEITVKSLEMQDIIADEASKHTSYKKYLKAVRRRRMESKYNVPSVFELMDEDEEFKKRKKKKKKDAKKKDKKKDKKKKKKDKIKNHKYGEPVREKERKRKLSKEEQKALSEADRKAKARFDSYLKKAAKGDLLLY